MVQMLVYCYKYLGSEAADMCSLPSQPCAVENSTRNYSEGFQALFYQFSLVWVLASALVYAWVNQDEILPLRYLGCELLDVTQTGAQRREKERISESWVDRQRLAIFNC